MTEPDTVIITVKVTDWRDVDIGEHRDVLRLLIRAILNAANDTADAEDIEINSGWDTPKDQGND